MIKFEHLEVVGLEPALRGMRNPYDSWDKSDSEWQSANFCDADFVIGDADMELCETLNKGGSVNAKYRRFINVYVDITAPLYWWKEFDTYRDGVEKNSCSTMHTIHKKEFTLDMFSTDHLDDLNRDAGIIAKNELQRMINYLNKLRKCYLDIDAEIKNNKELSTEQRIEMTSRRKAYWYQIIQLLPSSFNQKRTVMMSYEALANMYRWRHDHKLMEWREFCGVMASDLPYSTLFID